MANNLFNDLNGNAPSGLGQMYDDFKRFKQSFRGDARAEVQRLLNSGQMSQAQYNELARKAQELNNLFSKMK